MFLAIMFSLSLCFPTEPRTLLALNQVCPHDGGMHAPQTLNPLLAHLFLGPRNYVPSF